MIYLDLVMILNFLVDFLLLIGTNRLTGYPAGWKRAAATALLGAFYAGGCMFPGFRFLSNTFWRLVCLTLMAGIAFGMNRSGAQRGAVFVLLSMALGGIALGTGKQNMAGLILCALLLWVLCRMGFRGGLSQREYVSVRLRYGAQAVTRIALRDTGNTLKDPLTGESVLVAGPDDAWELLRLTEDQLRHPVETVASGCLTGLRLIPYCTVGQPGGFLLAFRFRDGRIGERKACPLVAFTPERIGKRDVYQMLTGGVI